MGSRILLRKPRAPTQNVGHLSRPAYTGGRHTDPTRRERREGKVVRNNEVVAPTGFEPVFQP